MRYLIYTAPTFNPFAFDLFKKIKADEDGDTNVFGLIGGKNKSIASRGLEMPEENFLAFETMQRDWATTPASHADIEQFMNTYGQSTFARCLIADRFIARGYVSCGIAKPHPEIDEYIGKDKSYPTNYVINIFKAVEDLFDAAKPDAVFSYTIANSAAFVVYAVARRRGIPFGVLRETRVDQKYVVDLWAESELWPVFDAYKRNCVSEESLERAKGFLNDFRDKPAPPEYFLSTLKAQKSRHAWKTILESLWLISKHRLYYLLDRSVGRLKKADRAWFRLMIEMRGARDLKAWLSNTHVPDGPYAFYPLHYDPESSTMVQSPMHTDQLAVIEALSKSLPPGMPLVVKEHMPMIGRRPAGFYQRIAGMPNVHLISPTLSGLDLVQRAALVAVITGTSGWEALCLGVPTLVIGHSHYLKLGEGAVHETSLDKLGPAIERALAMAPISDDTLIQYLGAMFDVSFDMPISMAYDGYASFPEAERTRVIGEVAKRLRAFAAGETPSSDLPGC